MRPFLPLVLVLSLIASAFADGVSNNIGGSQGISPSGITSQGIGSGSGGGSPPALDCTGNGSTSIALTGCAVNALIIVAMTENAATAVSLSDTGGLTWTCRKNTTSGTCASPTGASLVEFWACFPAGGSTTISMTATGNSFLEGTAFGIKGTSCNSSAFDPNASLPGAASSGTITGATTNGNDFTFALTRHAAGTAGVPATWTQAATNTFSVDYYKTFAVAQASLLFPNTTTTGNNGMIADAVSAGTPSSPTCAGVIDTSVGCPLPMLGM